MLQMRKYRLSIQRMMMAVLMLMMFNISAGADVDVLLNKEYEGGKVAEILQEENESGGTTVYIAVSPAKGFTIKIEDVHVEPVIPASSQSRADTPELAQELTLSGSKKTVSYPNYAVYSFTVPDGLNAWVRNVEFQKKREGAKGGEFTLTYHIINLGKLDNNGKITNVRTEALQFTSEESKVAVPDKYKSPLAKNWKYYSASDVSFDQDTRTCTFNSEPSLNETDPLTLTANTDIYVTYELDENALNTVGLADGGIYRISRSGKKFLYQSHWQGDPNVYFDTSDKSTSPTDAIYLWKFNIVDPYQITIQSKSAEYYDYFLSSKAGSYGDIRLRSPLSTAKDNKVWSFGLLNGDSGYRLIITDGYKLAPDGSNGLDDFGHGYLNNNDNGKARYQKYAGNDYKNSDLTFVPLERTYTYNIVNKQGNIAISTELTQAVGKLSGYNDIPESIRSPYIDGETVTFYSFTGDYSSAYLSDENIITEMPLTDANIYVTYTTNLTGKFLNLQGTHAYNIKVGDNYIYDSGSGTLSNDPDEENKGNTNHLWYFTGGDPYSIQVENVATGYYLNSSSSTLLLSTTAENFILINRTIGEGSEQIGLKNATGETIQMNALALSGLSVNYYLIDKAGKLIFDPQSSTSEELALPSEWVSPLVLKYHYYKTITYDNESETYSNPTDEISSPAEVGNGGNIYVTYDAVTTIDFSGTKTYLLKFHDGVEFNQEDGSDAVDTTPMKAVYPYNNGDFHLYVYGDEQWVDQQAKGSSTRSRWLWKLISENSDPYHVIIKSNQNQSLKVDGDPKEGHSYLRTYKPDGYTSVVTGVAYENPVYFGSDSWRNGNATEYMILGTSLDKLILKTFDKINDGNTDERRKVTSFEQYWKNNPTAYNILKEAGHTVTEDKGVNVELSTDEKAVLTGLGWHTYQVWANSADWSSDPKKSKSMAIGWHWFQTISMGSGEFSIEEFSLEPQVILIDQHGWEIMRLPLSETEKLKKFDSPMVKEYKWYPFATKAKADGYHKYSVSDISGEIKVYVYDGATKKWKEDSTFPTEPPYTSTSLALNPYNNPDNHIVTPTCTESTCTDPTEHSKQPKSVMTDFLVIYTVKSAFANSYKGASSANETSASAFLVKQNSYYATIESSTSTSIIPKSDRPAMNEDVPENMLWYLRPNFDIDYEMGYKYAGETGAQEGAKTKDATEADYVAHDQNGFDPYNVQIQSKAYPLRYITSRTTGSELDGGIWTGTSSSVELQNLRTDRQTATGYDHTTLNITNATFMVVDDGIGNMLLVPRFDQQDVMSSFSSFTSLASVNETMSVTFEKIEKAKVIHSSSEIDSDDMSGNYVLAPDFTFTSNYTSLGTESKPFKGTIDGQLNAITAPSVPLVAYASASAVIKNVILEGVSITTGENVGAICNVADGGTRIYNCGVLSGSVSGSNYVGGLVGWLKGEARVINCYSYANVSGGTMMGGIVGNNAVATTADATDTDHYLKTMVMNCMFYGNITGGSAATMKPVYGGQVISNAGTSGINGYNYYRNGEDVTFDDNYADFAAYYCTLPADEEYLTRFEYYRSILNSNRQLCVWWITGKKVTKTEETDELQTTSDLELIAKWVLDPEIAPYPILKKWGKYPSVINQDPEYVWNPKTQQKISRATAEPYQGKRLGTINVIVNAGAKHAGTSTPSTTLTPIIMDMDTLNHDYCYTKIQLPYYNELFGDPSVQLPAPSADDYTSKWKQRYGGNYTDYVVTGWKITSITGGTAGSFKGYAVTSVPSATSNVSAGTVTPDEISTSAWEDGFNFADRKCTNKDLYSKSGRVFAQGGYYYVPEGVTSIIIEAYWGKAVYLHNKGHYMDRVNVAAKEASDRAAANTGPDFGSAFTPAGTMSTTFQGETVTEDLQAAISALTNNSQYTVYDQAIVLVGNVQVKNRGGSLNNGGSRAFTIMSCDLDLDNEPDYCLQFQQRNTTNRPAINPVRFDFLPVPELGLAIRTNTLAYAIGLMVPKGHFEITETSFMHTTQFEYDADNISRVESPIILNGGHFEQIVVRQGPKDKVNYFLLGGHFRMKRFTPGYHASNISGGNVRHCVVNAVGGDYPEFYLSGIYKPNQAVNADNPHCYINGGRFGTLAGAGYEQVDGDVTFKIDHAIIDEFYGGGINAAKPVTGKIDVTINNSLVGKYCGGPKVGVMSTVDGKLKTVTTNATGTTFGVFYGGGNGGTSYYRENKYDNTREFPTTDNEWKTDNGGYTPKFNAFTPLNQENVTAAYKKDEGANWGYHAEYEFEVFNASNGLDSRDDVIRLYYRWAQFGTTITGDVTNTLTNCIVTGDFFGGGNLASVTGNVTSTLKGNTHIYGSAYAAGFSASIPSFPVHEKSTATFPKKDNAGNVAEQGSLDYYKDGMKDRMYTWCYKNASGKVFPEGVVIPPGYIAGTKQKSVFKYPNTDDGKWYVLTTTSLEDLGAVSGNAEITLDEDCEIDGSVFGGGDSSEVKGNSTVNIQGNTLVKGNVFGGGNKGLVSGNAKVDIGTE